MTTKSKASSRYRRLTLLDQDYAESTSCESHPPQVQIYKLCREPRASPRSARSTMQRAIQRCTGNTALHGLCVIAITKASNDASRLLHAADSRINMSIKTHLVPSTASGLAGLGLLTSALCLL
ncbi:hypothetical protein LA080_010531 [Diaporthe eres]|nr:hypothetical protein LA080_010531 [Diaporthe eres]